MGNPYLVRVSDLLRGRETNRRLSVVAPLTLHLDQVKVEGEANVNVLLEGLGDRLTATGTVEVEIEGTCVRCLTSWHEGLTAPIAAVFSEEPGDDEYPVFEGHSIDLSQPARDEVAAAVPLLPLCRADCLGLCPVCGTDLNTDGCPGHEAEDDSPFAALRPLVPD